MGSVQLQLPLPDFDHGSHSRTDVQVDILAKVFFGISDDTVFTTCMNKVWDGATHRILRNSTFTEWEKFGYPKAGSGPGEKDKITRYGNAADDEYTIERYSIDSPGHSINSDIEALANYAGMDVESISDKPNVSNLVCRIWKEFESC